MVTLVGDSRLLGKWKIPNGIQLSFRPPDFLCFDGTTQIETTLDPYDYWYGIVTLPNSTPPFQYKFVLDEDRWEGSGPAQNRKMSLLQFTLLSSTEVSTLIARFSVPLDPRVPTGILKTATWNDKKQNEHSHTANFSRYLTTSGSMYCSKILDNLWVGSCPRRPEHLSLIKEIMGITAVLNLQEHSDIKHNCNLLIDNNNDRSDILGQLEYLYDDRGIVLIHQPTRDMESIARKQMMPTAALILGHLLEVGHVVYIHCNAGVGRAVAATVAHLICGVEWCPEMAALYVSMARPIAYFDWDALNTVHTQWKRKFLSL